jgi:hypothetical protein
MLTDHKDSSHGLINLRVYLAGWFVVVDLDLDSDLALEIYLWGFCVLCIVG